jgi:FkbM family methyltransferase
MSSLYFALKFSDAKIIAIEPDSENFQILRKNTLNYTLELINKAVWSSNQELGVFSGFRDGLPWSRTVSEITNYSHSHIKVHSITVGEILGLANGYIDVLKIDIEGSEKNLFEGDQISNLLAVTKFIAIEIHDEFRCRQLICDKLSDLGFKWFNSGEITIGENSFLIG